MHRIVQELEKDLSTSERIVVVEYLTLAAVSAVTRALAELRRSVVEMGELGRKVALLGVASKFAG